jgi:hypothetical protein
MVHCAYMGQEKRSLNQFYVITLKLNIVPKLWDSKVEVAIPSTFRTTQMQDITIFHKYDIY